MRTRIPALAAFAAATLLVTACGNDTAAEDPTTSAPPTPAATAPTAAPSPDAAPETPTAEADYPVTVTDSLGDDVTLEAQPDQIVSLSPTGTEMLFAIGAGDQVVAVDSYSYYPEEAPVTDMSAYQPNVEAITTYEPDLVLMSDSAQDAITALRDLEIPTIVLSSAMSLDDTYAQIRLLGEATGHVTEAEATVEEIQSGLDAAVAGAEMPEESLTYYHELDDTYFSVTSSTFIGQIYGLFGLENIADEAEGDNGGYPQLSAEFIIEADPDLIFLADTQCCGVTPESVADRDGWSTITAIQDGNIFAVDEDIASRWGPRVVQFAESVADAIQQATAGEDG